MYPPTTRKENPTEADMAIKKPMRALYSVIGFFTFWTAVIIGIIHLAAYLQ